MTEQTKKYDDVLEENVSHLLEGGDKPPQIDAASRTRVRDHLIAKHQAMSTTSATPVIPMRRPLFAVGLGLAAAAAGAFVVTRVIGGTPDREGTSGQAVTGGGGKLADGSTWLVEAGAKVTQLGPRHVRVEGAALLDVVPGGGVFTVDTEHGTIEVLGTKFLVDADEAQTKTAVVRGSVKLVTPLGNVVLHAGEQGVAEKSKSPTRGPAPRLSNLVSWAQQARRAAEGQDLEPLHRGTLFAKDPGIRSHPPWGDEYPLPMKQLKVDVVVENQVARVALDQTFHNDQNEVLEGTYRFAIPPDAALQRLAMYVDGKLMESAVVERMRARAIYEELVYRRVDPALLEWAGTGRLNLRIYPLPARQDKRIMLAYTQSLPKLYDDWTITVPFPEIDQPVGEVLFDVRVKDCQQCELTSTSHAITTKADGNDQVVSYKKSGDKLGDSLVLHVRDATKKTVVATSGTGDERYMMVRAPANLAGETRAYRPRTWVILDDVSASRGKQERRAQADMIQAFFKELDEEDQVSVVAFDVQARTILAPTRVLDVDHAKVRKALDQEGDVGATDFASALDTATSLLQGVAPDDAMIVYVGDGVITSGTRKLDELRAQVAGKAQFIGIGVGDGPDTQTIEALAAATGGYATTIDLSDDVAWRTFDVVAALHTARATGVEAKLVDQDGKLVPATLYLRTPQVADGEELELVAKLAGTGTPVAVELTGTRDGKPWTQRLALDAQAQAREGAAYLPRLWAQRHVAARMLAKHVAIDTDKRAARDEEIRQEVVALGKKYFLLSRHTSLLVLENDAMYTQYGVTKGAGDTWAPYVIPATIPVVTDPLPAGIAGTALALPDVAPDAELVRAPLPYFYDYSTYYSLHDRRTRGGWVGNDGWDGDMLFALDSTTELRSQRGGARIGRGTLRNEREVGGAADEKAKSAGEAQQQPYGTTATATPIAGGDKADDAPFERDANKQQVVMTDALHNGVLGAASGPMVAGTGTGAGYGVGGGGRFGGGLSYQQQMSLVRFTHPQDRAFDDLSAWVPALLRDSFTVVRGQLLAIGGAKPHSIDAAAKDLLAKARASVATGVYRWGDFEIAIDAQRRLGWRRITEANLHETAAYDGTTWTRRYAELGMEVTRKLGDDDVALVMGYLPLLIADPAHYARWFDVTAKGKVVTLATKGKPMFTIELDDAARVVAIANANGQKLVEIAWSSTGPMAATVGGKPVEVGFVAQAIGDAMSWAHQSVPAQPVVIELPLHLVAHAQDAVKKETVGAAPWRHAQRQLMASYLAVENRGSLSQVYTDLRAHGGVELGDLALAAPALISNTTDKDFADGLAPFGTKADRSIIARYVFASRAFAKDGKPATLAHPTEGGLVAQLYTLREASALLANAKAKQAVDALLTIDGRAPALRTIGAMMVGARYDVKAEDVVRIWESAAVGDLKNVARAQAAIALTSRGQYDLAAERFAALVADYDLKAQPANLVQAPAAFSSSRRGMAGWQIVWASLRERVLASGDYDHVMALLPATAYHPGDAAPILQRAAVLAGDDVDKRVALAEIALSRNQPAVAQGLIDPLLVTKATPALFELASRLALQQGRYGDALNALESAQDAAPADEAIDVNVVRQELGRIIAVAQQAAVASTGTTRQDAIDRAMGWGKKWRQVDPGNPQVDTMLGDLLLAVGDTAGAWRQLSTVIERNPMSGDGYMTVAETFERQGRVSDAIAYWQAALVLEQTNPTPRMRKAQALIAVGKTAEGDQLLRDIAGRPWHERWSGVVWQAKSMLEQAQRK